MSELVAELNRLGLVSGKEERAAANAWAGLSGSSTLDTLGALNYKNGSTGLGLNAVCNALAGLTGNSRREAQAALATIATPSSGTPSTGLTLPGTSGNYLSAPDSSDLDITGDLTLMFDGALTDWTPAALTVLVGKATTSNLSYRLVVVTTTGVLRLNVSSAGASFLAANSSIAPTVADGAFLAVGVTWRASDGRTQFWTAPTGTTTVPGGVGWTQLGTDQTQNVGSLYSGTALMEIGSSVGGTALLLTGAVRRARAWASIDGSDQRFDANCVGVSVTGTRLPATITDAAKSATVTVNGSAWDWATT